MLVSTFQLHNVVKKPHNELGLKPCCLEILRANNLLPFEASPLQAQSSGTNKQPSPAMLPEESIGNILQAFKELGKEAASVGK